MRVITDQLPLFGPDRGSMHFYETTLQVGPREERALRALVQVDDDLNAVAVNVQRSVAAALVELMQCEPKSDAVDTWLTLRDIPKAQQLLGIHSKNDAPYPEVAAAFARKAFETKMIGDAYCEVIPADLRHRLGEHYTPYWLAERIAGLVSSNERVCDPACGDARFLVALIRNGHSIDNLSAVGLSPIAVLLARFNVWLALGKTNTVPRCRIDWDDFLLGGWVANSVGRKKLPVDVFVGNPPWVTWRTIPSNYRKMLSETWAGSSMNVRRGWEARVSAGQTDLAHLFIHEAVERVATNGRILFVLPRSTFKGPVGAAPIRSGLSSSGRKFGYTEVWDIGSMDAFADVRSDTTVAAIQADAAQQYPVQWKSISANVNAPTRIELAVPSDPTDLGSAWTNDGPGGSLILTDGEHRADLRARGGINTGGANSVFHVEEVERSGSLVKIRNVISRKAGPDMPAVVAEVEATYIRPLLRGRDIQPWSARASQAIVVAHQASDFRKPVPEHELASQNPRTLAYLERFRGPLQNRKELARWGGDWHALFRIGPYTADCWRVVWPHSSGQSLRAAILSPNDRTVPDQKVVLVAFETPEPALFYCALLNSEPIRRFVQSASGLDASPNIVKRVPLPRFDEGQRVHSLIVEFAIHAIRTPHNVDQVELGRLVGELYL